MHRVRQVRRRLERSVEPVRVAALDRAEHLSEHTPFELLEPLAVLRSQDGEIALQPAHAPREVGCERPVAAARSVRALPPAERDRLHHLARPREELGDLLERELGMLRAHQARAGLVGHGRIIRGAHELDRGLPPQPRARRDATRAARAAHRVELRPALHKAAGLLRPSRRAGLLTSCARGRSSAAPPALAMIRRLLLAPLTLTAS